METAQWDRSVTVRCGVGRFVRHVGACLRSSLCVCLSLRVYLVRALDVPRPPVQILVVVANIQMDASGTDIQRPRYFF